MYLPKALSDSKLVKDVFFTKNGKNLVAEYFKYHKQQSDLKLTNFEMRSYNDIGILIVKLVTHVKELWEVSSCYDIEPLMCKKLLDVKNIYSGLLLIYDRQDHNEGCIEQGVSAFLQGV